MINCI